jgi:hypothetical protein
MISCTVELINFGVVLAAFVIGGLVIMAFSCWYFKGKGEQ